MCECFTRGEKSSKRQRLNAQPYHWCMGEYPSEVQEEEMILVTNKIAKLSLKVSPVKRKRATLKTEAIVTKQDNTDVTKMNVFGAEDDGHVNAEVVDADGCRNVGAEELESDENVDVESQDTTKVKRNVMQVCSPMLALTMKNWLGVDGGNRRLIRKIEGKEASPLGKRKTVKMTTPKPALRSIRKVDNGSMSGKKKKLIPRNMVKEMIIEYENRRKQENERKEVPNLTSETLTIGENAQATDMGRVFVVKKTAKQNRGSGGDMTWQSENANIEQDISSNSRVGHQGADVCTPRLTSKVLSGFLNRLDGQPSLNQNTSNEFGGQGKTEISQGVKGVKGATLEGKGGPRGDSS